MPLPTQQMRSLLTRLRLRADEAAAGSAVPAGTEPDGDGSDARPTARERGAMRRRLRQLRRRREALLLELGALVYEMHRRERHDAELVARRAGEVGQIHDEETALATALGEGSPLVELVAAGIAGPCPACGELVGTSDSYCARCGTEQGAGIGATSGPNGSHARREEGATAGAAAVEDTAPAEDDTALEGTAGQESNGDSTPNAPGEESESS